MPNVQQILIEQTDIICLKPFRRLATKKLKNSAIKNDKVIQWECLNQLHCKQLQSFGTPIPTELQNSFKWIFKIQSKRIQTFKKRKYKIQFNFETQLQMWKKNNIEFQD